MDISKIFPYKFSEGECGKAEFCYWFFFRDDEYKTQTIRNIISHGERYRNIASKSAMYNFFKKHNLDELHKNIEISVSNCKTTFQHENKQMKFIKSV